MNDCEIQLMSFSLKKLYIDVSIGLMYANIDLLWFCDDGDDEDCNIFDGFQAEDDESEDDDEEVIVKKKPIKKATKKAVAKAKNRK